MRTQRIEINNRHNQTLSARLELPVDQKAHNIALFAHCFTCNKDLAVVRNLSRALTQAGFGVMRFDFTGLGRSGGEFSDTSFANNIQDIIDVAAYLDEHYVAPTLMIGHSLGGAAAIVAGNQLASIKAVATIGAPASVGHVAHLFEQHLEEIKESGTAEVKIGGRSVKIGQEFIDDLESRDLIKITKTLKKPILIAHSPQDTVVGVENASALYQAAFHPKSFLSLDGADHMLSNPEDSIYVGNVLASWAKRYLEIEKEALPKTNMQVVAHMGEEGYTTHIKVGNHTVIADEPASVGGDDFGPSPYEFVSAGLGACTAMTLRMYANRKKWDLRSVNVHLEHSKEHFEDCNTCDDKPQKIDVFKRVIEIEGDLTEEQRNRLIEIADKCPVHKTLHNNEVKIETSLR